MAVRQWEPKREYVVTVTDGKGTYTLAVITTTQEQSQSALDWLMKQPDVKISSLRWTGWLMKQPDVKICR